MIYLVYESDSQMTFASTLIATFSSMKNAQDFIVAKNRTATWEIYTIKPMQIDVGDVDVILQDGEYLNISEPVELSEIEMDSALDEIYRELYGAR